jgi:hypothetical protein
VAGVRGGYEPGAVEAGEVPDGGALDGGTHPVVEKYRKRFGLGVRHDDIQRARVHVGEGDRAQIPAGIEGRLRLRGV